MTYRDATHFYDQIQARWREQLPEEPEFTVTEEHLALARRANIGWNWTERAAGPGLNWKRPYGNSDWHEDIAEIVDGAFLGALGDGARQDYIEAHAERWDRLHAEMTIVLQIFLDTRSFEPGRYKSDTGGWRKAD
ncbi:hypothetical protein [Nocardiopsis sp. CA-288880]|uniref:hypothetical protein n=1 Tax=Nocardiopsis sp. CA-288880 TaxID=3239995 RepID=UPI003D97ACD2